MLREVDTLNYVCSKCLVNFVANFCKKMLQLRILLENVRESGVSILNTYQSGTFTGPWAFHSIFSTISIFNFFSTSFQLAKRDRPDDDVTAVECVYIMMFHCFYKIIRYYKILKDLWPCFIIIHIFFVVLFMNVSSFIRPT